MVRTYARTVTTTPRSLRLLAVGLVVALGAGACASDDAAEPEDAATTTEDVPATADAAAQDLEWDDCGPMECTTVEVPLDFEEPDGEQIDIPVARVPAGDPDERIGVLIVNPGGPGFPATQFVASAASFLPREVTERFDIVGYDSRGTGGALGVDCTDDLDAVYALDPTPDSAAEEAERDDVGAALAEACEEEAGDDLRWVSTERTARDLDVIRDALGEEQLNLLGYSYGSYLGGAYADLFPERVRAFVLDGAVDPTLDPVEQFVQQADGGEVALMAFLDDCADDPSCPFNDGSDLVERFDRLMAAIDDDPLPTDDGEVLGPGEAHLGVFGSLFSQGDWSSLAEGLADATDGDGTGLYQAFAAYVSRIDDGEYADISEGYWAISVADGLLPTTLEEYDEILEVEPRLGPAIIAENVMSAYWPVPPEREPRPWVAEGSNPILVISTTRDPATPYEAGVALAEQLDNGVLLSYDGDGHTVYANGVDCVDDIVNAYLIDLEVPDGEGASC